LIKYLLPHIDGVLACGTAGEFVYLSDEEKRRIFEITVNKKLRKALTIKTI